MRARSLLVGLVLWSLPTSAADFWQRTKGRERTSERETLQALYRALAGTSDSIDELLVRTSIVDDARGKIYEDPLTLVYVLRARRLLGLARQPDDVLRLRAASESEASGETVALAAIELGRLLRLDGDLARARAEFDRALGRAWQSPTRVEAHFLRGFLAVEQADLAGARADFQAALAFDLGRSQLSLALMSLALVDHERGDAAEARRLYARARRLSRGGSAVNGGRAVDRPELLASDRARLLEVESLLESAGHGDEDDLDP